MWRSMQWAFGSGKCCKLLGEYKISRNLYGFLYILAKESLTKFWPLSLLIHLCKGPKIARMSFFTSSSKQLITCKIDWTIMHCFYGGTVYGFERV
jgi:hypothetical protein